MNLSGLKAWVSLDKCLFSCSTIWLRDVIFYCFCRHISNTAEEFSRTPQNYFVLHYEKICLFPFCSSPTNITHANFDWIVRDAKIRSSRILLFF